MKLYTKKDIEDIFKISRATVYRWCREGDFPQPINFKKGRRQYWRDDEIKNMKELPKVVAGTPVGESVPLIILRNGKELTLNVKLGELELAEKENLIGKTSSKDAKSKQYDKLGFVAEELNSKNKSKFKLKNIDKGVIITSVKDNSSAQDAGLTPGMVIIRVGQIEVNSLKVIDEAIKNALKQKRKALLLLVKVENGSRFVALELK